jgi:hypothetical protein
MGQLAASQLEAEFSEQYWIGIVEESVALGWSHNTVPAISISKDTAEALAKQLNLRLLVRGPDYVFSC